MNGPPRFWLLTLLLLASCASGTKSTDPLTDLRNPALSALTREAAIARAWQMAQAGTLDRTAVREDLKVVAWSRHWDLSLRLATLNILLTDTDDKGREDTRAMVRLMLPRESAPRVTQLLAGAAEKNGWKETTPALVRSLSIPWIGVADRDRPESQALRKLNPADSLERIVYRVFRDPPDDGGSFGLVTPDKVRADAWNVLRRLDPDGAARSALVAEDSGGPAENIRAALNDLKVMPDTGEELTWLSSLRSSTSPSYRDWWAKVSGIVGSLQPAQTARLRLRHLAAIKWAAEGRPEWLQMSQPNLITELDLRLQSRKTHRRTTRDPGEPRPAPEKLSDWRDSLSWGDVLSILVIDEAIHDAGVPAVLFSQAAMDKDDRTAEYGGLVRSDDSRALSVVLFPPRPGARRGDNEFVASSDMFAQGDHALAHYHFHAQDTHNNTFAGPSSGDLAYAARHARNCLVLTSVSSRALNADVYTPDGAVIDLGEVTKP